MEATSHGIALPEVGQWYRRADGSLFEVVALDVEDATIEIQDFDGTIEEYDYYAWVEQKATTAKPPEDWSGSVDISGEDHPDPQHHVTLTLDDSLNLIEQLDDPSEVAESTKGAANSCVRQQPFRNEAAQEWLAETLGGSRKDRGRARSRKK